VALFPWRKPKPAAELTGGASSSTGALGMLGPATGYGGDQQGFAELVRRAWEQSFLDTGTVPPGMGGGWAPFVTEWQARQIPALTAGLMLISSVVMQLPLRQTKAGRVVDPPAAIVRNPTPGPNRTLADFLDEYLSDVILYGNYAALLGPPDSTGYPAQIIPLDVTTVSVARDPATWQPVYALAGIDELIPADRIFHVALNKRSGELAGRGVLTMSGALGAALAADSYAGRYFTDSGMPSGVITDSRPNLTLEQATELKQRWMQATSGGGRPVVIPPSTTFTALAANANDAQLVQARQWDAQTVAMMIGIPPFLLGIETQRHTYTNAENEFGRFVTTSIMRLLAPLEQQLSDQCLPGSNKAEFWTGALLRADTSTRAAAAVSLYGAEIITLAEARTLAGFSPDGGPPESTPQPAAAPAAAPPPSSPDAAAELAAHLHLVES
jgi:HK97 family phage portal protein